ncbi:siderophore-interacting protein [Chitinimonas sp.]|uniref:siderophore-interacting protein n=1 Tax=Chitinimonas sp. TaxID=1934313 RepID=UPI002F9223D8
MNAPDYTVTRVRHPLKFRLLEVSRIRAITPQLVRITFRGEDLQDFVSASFDDHVKLFFPAPGEDKPLLPEMGPNGLVFPEGKRPTARDYTPRSYDPVAQELDIEFVLHGEGPATSWAAQAKVGQYLGVGGPRGSLIIPTHFDWHVLIGDESALPAIGRRLEELPAGSIALVVAEVENDAARIDFNSDARVETHWVYRQDRYPGDPASLEDAVRDLILPAGEGYVWAAGESAVIQSIRKHLVEDRAIAKSRIRAASYWKQGAVAVHETHED